jgi:predicted O-methyltransferase YrrM
VRSTATELPPDFPAACDAAWHHVRETPGYLAEREAKFLMLAAACAPASGAIVEIGSFKGRSTIGLAAMAQRYGLGTVVAVDPHTSPSETDPDLGGVASSYGDFRANLERAGVASIVDSRRMRSHQLAGIWNQPIRLLWIDGDHTYAAVKDDLARFRPYLERGGILAMHDVLGTWEGPLRVFVEDVLESDDFGPAGFCGSIGWAQYLPGEGGARRLRWSRHRLAWAARHLIPVARAGLVASGLNKWRYKLWRALAPHHAVDPAHWVARVRLPRHTGP